MHRDQPGLRGGGAGLLADSPRSCARSRAARSNAAGLVACIAGTAVQLRLRARQPGDRTAGRVPLGLRHPAARPAGRRCRPRSTHGRASCPTPWRSTARAPSFSRERPSHGAGRATEVVMSRSNGHGWHRRWRWPCCVLQRCGAQRPAAQPDWRTPGAAPARTPICSARCAPWSGRRARPTARRSCCSARSADLISQSRGVVPDAGAGAHPARPRPGGARSAARAAGRGDRAAAGAAARRAAARARSTMRRPCPASAARSPCAGWSAGRRRRWPRGGPVRRGRTRHRAQPRGLGRSELARGQPSTCTTCRRG